jgi:hypothetical protein
MCFSSFTIKRKGKDCKLFISPLSQEKKAKKNHVNTFLIFYNKIKEKAKNIV